MDFHIFLTRFLIPCKKIIDKQQITMRHFEKNSRLLSMVALVASDQFCIEELIRGKLESCSVALKCKGHTDIQGGLKDVVYLRMLPQ